MSNSDWMGLTCFVLFGLNLALFMVAIIVEAVGEAAVNWRKEGKL